jgi:hypothetical protein
MEISLRIHLPLRGGGSTPSSLTHPRPPSTVFTGPRLSRLRAGGQTRVGQEAVPISVSALVGT